jgi:hypothetical protein
MEVRVEYFPAQQAREECPHWSSLILSQHRITRMNASRWTPKRISIRSRMESDEDETTTKEKQHDGK